MNEPWSLNYYNYFTEVEEHFQRARGTGLFLLSPLDWALIETWKNAGIPLEAVLRGIDAAFEKWRSKKQRGRSVNGLAWCSQAVIEEADRMQSGTPPPAQAEAPFSFEDLQAHLKRCRAEILAANVPELQPVAAALEELLNSAEEHYNKLEALESKLTGLEDKMVAIARAKQTEADAMEIRTDLDAQLKPHRGRMTTPQIAMLEKQFLDRMALERLRLPRLSLFYLR
jgi:hypothetical protein